MEMTKMESGQDDGHTRTGTLWSGTAHAITATIGSGILALPWSVAQLGWIVGPISVACFAVITYYTAVLLCDCYRSPDPVNGTRNPTYTHAVRAFLGERSVLLCSVIQYSILWGTMIGYTITTAISVAGLRRSICHHQKGPDGDCAVNGNEYMLAFGAVQLVLSQCPNLEKVTFLSIIAALTSIGYSTVSLCLSIIKFAMDPEFRGSLAIGNTGKAVPSSTKVWNGFQALGNIAFAYTYAMLLLEIQDTLRPTPPENKVMKRVSLYSVSITAMFYICLGCIGYLAFGGEAPGNILSKIYQPFWLVSIGHLCVIIHLIGAYPVFAQPIFAVNENWLASRLPASGFFNRVHSVELPCLNKCRFHFTLCRLLIRPAFVVVTTALAMMFPFFNAILGLLGAISFWPLTVYFPVSMYIVQASIKKGSGLWIFLQTLSGACLIVSLIAGIGSIAGMSEELSQAKLMHIKL
uniref:Amino acid transporter transmembrane domain-containing protein n=1 Tax=Kalanchoe fedtschenkoi TaxID=63787 RepID=A0A7N0U7R8_KALFE